MIQPFPDGTYPDQDDDDGAQSRSNEHVDRMAEVLLTYNFYEKELGMWRGTHLFPRLWARCFALSLSRVYGTDEMLSCWLGICDVGYVQGMSDLCAPVYVVSGADEAVTFWCFVSVMDRMVRPYPLLLVPLPLRRNTDADNVENQLPPRSKRDEEAALNTTAAPRSSGSRAIPALREDGLAEPVLLLPMGAYCFQARVPI